MAPKPKQSYSTPQVTSEDLTKETALTCGKCDPGLPSAGDDCTGFPTNS